MYTLHSTMNIYSEDLYADILKEDTVYNSLQRIERKVKNTRRTQRRKREAQRNARYDSF